MVHARVWSSLIAVCAIASCSSGCPAAKCGPTELSVDTRALPEAWTSVGTFTLCEGNRCTTQRKPFTAPYPQSVYPFGASMHRSITQGVARHVSLRVVVAGKEVVNVRARAFRAEPVSNPEGCEVCGRSVRLLLNPDGTYLSRIGP